jgi:hypothetical protein
VIRKDGLPGEQNVPLQTLREWIRSDDPLLHYLAFHTAYSHPDTVSGLSDEERLDICLLFLEAGISGRYGEAIPDGPYVLAHTVLGWLRVLTESDNPFSQTEARAILRMIECVARRGDPATREVLLLGILEHAFQSQATRALFDEWLADPQLARLYQEAVDLSR